MSNVGPVGKIESEGISERWSEEQLRAFHVDKSLTKKSQNLLYFYLKFQFFWKRLLMDLWWSSTTRFCRVPSISKVRFNIFKMAVNIFLESLLVILVSSDTETKLIITQGSSVIWRIGIFILVTDLLRKITKLNVVTQIHYYRSGTLNSNTVNSKFHLIRSFFKILTRILSFHV